jgi:signal transduction histidine kinase
MANAGTAAPLPGGSARSSDYLRVRELELVREIATAFLRAPRAVEVYRLALHRLTPLVQASFASVFLRDPGDPDLLKLECVHNWPQASARYLSQLRVRVGLGPTGRAVAERRAIEVQDVLAEPATGEWSRPAAELGFRSMIALPLLAGDEAMGALSFYFAEHHDFRDDERHLLVLVAEQLAAMSQKAAQVDELREANLRLQRQNESLLLRAGDADEVRRLKDDFLANVSHELRTPLTSILGYAFLLANDAAATPQQRSMLERIDASANTLLGRITEMLELAHVKLGREELTIADDDALRIARRAVECAGEPKAGVEFGIEPADGRIAIRTDGERAARILEKLLDNAFRFTRQGAVRIGVRESSQREWVEWEVRDTGPGLPAEALPGLFEEYRQLDVSNRAEAGAGLGLALARCLAEQLGGEIRVASQPGVGSSFTLRLPVLEAAPDESEPASGG